MSNTDFAMADVAEFDDLPRTLRREREAREREKRERAAREPALPRSPTASADRADDDTARPAPSLFATRDEDLDSRAASDIEFPAATVKRIDLPFFHMMTFYLKAVIAAIPALILLTAMLWGMGQMIKIFFPWLLKAQILIHFPN